MEISHLIEFINDIPIWAWFIIVITVFVFITGDTKLWEYEARFPQQDGIGRGEVELECYKKGGAKIEIKLTLEPYYQDKSVEIYLKNQLIYTLTENTAISNKGRINKREKIKLNEPTEGDEVTIKIAGKSIFTAPLIRD